MINKAEEFVSHLCRGTFLSLWSYANPLSKNGKELCDILVVSSPDIIIFSVKEIELKESGSIETDWKRWIRRAIESSADQIYGAERWLKSTINVIKSDGTLGIKLPAGDEQRIHRVAVALGGKDKVPTVYGDLGKGFVHVFDEISITTILQELDTITDFLDYLSAKERFYMAGKETPLLAGEENFLAFYLYNGKKIPDKYDVIMLDGNLWSEFIKKPEYLGKKEEDKISYVWDHIIEEIASGALKGTFEFNATLSDAEMILRTMAREDRFGRRILGKSFAEFIILSSQNKVSSRMLRSPYGVVYVLLATPHAIDRESRRAELGLRCRVARGLNLDCKTVIGIATEQSKQGAGHSFDLHYIYLPAWSEELQKSVVEIQKEFGFFAEPAKTELSEDEYPQ